MPTEPKPSSQQLHRGLKIAAIAAIGTASFIVLTGFYSRYEDGQSLKAWTKEAAVPTVSVVRPNGREGAQTLVLPGTLKAYYEAQIYARVPGYVGQWYKDIGAKVAKGDLLATISTPELDQQIAQAKADLASAVAAESLARTTSQRWAGLLSIDAVSKQEAEEKSGDLATKTALVKAAQANVDRLEDLKGFARLTAPFDGIVTARTADIGALVNAGSTANGAPLFSVADVHRIRIYVRVPQSYAAQIAPNATATLTLPEYPNRTFTANLVSTSYAMSEQSDTLLVELQADNSAGALKPGDYAEVKFALPHNSNVLEIPSSALMFRSAGLQVATVTANDRIVMKPIKVGRDLGAEVEVASGLGPQDRVVDNPPDSIATGDQVRVSGSPSDNAGGG